MPKLAALTRDTADVTIPIDGDDPLEITFRKGFMTPVLAAQFEAADDDTPLSEQLQILADMVLASVVKWNLTAESGEAIPLTREAIGNVNSEALTLIIRGIQDALRPDPTNGVDSSSTSSQTESSEPTPVRTGTRS